MYNKIKKYMCNNKNILSEIFSSFSLLYDLMIFEIRIVVLIRNLYNTSLCFVVLLHCFFLHLFIHYCVFSINFDILLNIHF